MSDAKCVFWQARIELHSRHTKGRSEKTVAHNIVVPKRRQPLKRKILLAYGGICVYCDAVADTVDHVVVASRGGPWCPCNLMAACKACNLRRGCRTVEEFVLLDESPWDEKKLYEIDARVTRARRRLLAALPRELLAASAGA